MELAGGCSKGRPPPPSPSQTSTHFFKCVMVGHPSVGKTCLTNRIATGKYIDCPITTFSAASVEVNVKLSSGAIVTVDLWDTAGQERYRSLTRSYFRDAKAVLVVYDAGTKVKIRDWLKEVDGHVTRGEALVFLVGTKIDLGTEVCLNDEEVQALSRMGDKSVEIGGHYVLSSKTGENVKESLERLAATVVVAAKEKGMNLCKRQGTVKAKTKGEKDNRRCC